MQNWPSWIPTPRFWVNAIALILLIIGLQYAIAYLGMIIFMLINLLPRVIFLKFIYLFSLVAQLSPIIAVAFVHHWLHRFLDNFFPESRVTETEATPGVLPSFLSWWEGLYGWSVNILSIVIASGLLGLFMPSPDLFNLLTVFKNELPHLPTISMFIQVIVAAYLYQFEYLVHQHLIAAARQ